MTDKPMSNEEILKLCAEVEARAEKVHKAVCDLKFEIDSSLSDVGRLAALLRAKVEQERWIPVSSGQLPEEGRVEIFSPIYAEGHEMRFRLVDSQFVKICKEATHWRKLTPPEVTK